MTVLFGRNKQVAMPIRELASKISSEDKEKTSYAKYSWYCDADGKVVCFPFFTPQTPCSVTHRGDSSWRRRSREHVEAHVTLHHRARTMPCFLHRQVQDINQSTLVLVIPFEHPTPRIRT